MKKIHKLLGAITLLGSSCSFALLTSCNNPNTDQCTVTIDLNGGSLDGQTGTIKKVIDKGTMYEELGTPTKDYCDFEGWLVNGELVYMYDYIFEDITIQASWTIQTADVTINLDGGTLEGETGTITKTVNKGTTYASLGLPERTDYDFIGWLVDGTTLVSQSDVITDSVYIVASWKIQQIKVTIDPNGGQWHGSSETTQTDVDKYSTYGEIDDPTRQDYYFVQWLKDGITPVGKWDPITEPVSIQASWTVETCDVTINLNGGMMGSEVGSFVKTVAKNSTYAQILSTPTYDSYHSFKGWLKDGSSFDLNLPITSDVTVSASWDETLAYDSVEAKYMRYNSSNTFDDSGYRETIYTFNNGQVPYMSVQEWFEQFGSSCFSVFPYGCKTLIRNKLNNSTCTIDVANQKIIFSDYDKFPTIWSAYSDNPLARGEGGGASYKLDRADEYVSGGQYTIDLSKYNIPIYSLMNVNGLPKDFIPIYFFRNIFGLDTAYMTFRKNVPFMFYGNNLYEINDTADATSVALYSEMKRIEGVTLSSDYREFCYNLLALTLDNEFGMTTRPSRSQSGQTITYFPNGAYQALAPYHEDFISNTGDVSNEAMIDIMKTLCDDGGHAGYWGNDFYATKGRQVTTADIGPEYYHTTTAHTLMKNARSSAGYEPLKNGTQIDVVSSSGSKKDIAWVTFDSFKAPSQTVVYDNVNESNYTNDTISMTMWLQKLVNATDSTIKNVVIDLTNNGGGTVYTEHFIASYLCGRDNENLPYSKTYGKGGVTNAIWDPHTGAYSKYTYYADINRDGDYDSDDYLPSDVKLFCITSDYSFSCANLLSCHLEGNCGNNCKFIGSRTGGGCCYVDSDMHVGLGNVIRSSSNRHSLKVESTISNKISADVGVTPEDLPITFDSAHAAQFFDRASIISWMLGQ